MSARRLRKIVVLVAGETAAELHDLPATGHISRSRDPLERRDVVKRRARLREVVHHRTDLDGLVPLRFLELLTLEMAPEPEESRHLGGRPELLWVSHPGVKPVEADLARDIPEARTHLWKRARGLGILEQACQLMRPRRQFRFTSRRRIAIDGISEPAAGLATVRCGTHVRHPAGERVAQFPSARIIRQRLGHLVEVRLHPQVRSDPLVGPGPAVDFMTAVAAVLPDQVVALDQLRRGRIGKPLTGLEIDDLVMTLQTARLLEPLREHRLDPVVVVEPAMVIVPLMPLLGRVRRVGGPRKVRGASLTLVTDRATKVLHRMRAAVAHEEIEPRMRGIRLGHSTTDH